MPPKPKSPRRHRSLITLGLVFLSAMFGPAAISTAYAEDKYQLTRGKSYVLTSALICSTLSAASELNDIRQTGDAMKVPSDCQHQKNIEVRFEEKLALKSPNVNIRLHAEGKDTCRDLKAGQNVRCDFWDTTYSVFVVFLPAGAPVRAYAYLDDRFNLSRD